MVLQQYKHTNMKYSLEIQTTQRNYKLVHVIRGNAIFRNEN